MLSIFFIKEKNTAMRTIRNFKVSFLSPDVIPKRSYKPLNKKNSIIRQFIVNLQEKLGESYVKTKAKIIFSQ